MQTQPHSKADSPSRWAGVVIGLFLVSTLIVGQLWAEPPYNGNGKGQTESTGEKPDKAKEGRVIGTYEPLTYTLGPDDVIEITVRRHPEFSGSYAIGKDGKIQYRFVGDIPVSGLNKPQVIEKFKEALATYVIDPEIDVIITDFRSKVVYVVGEVGRPGRYFLRSDQIPVREVIFEAGLPTLAASMRRTRIIHPQITEGKHKGQIPMDGLNLYALLYIGDLTKNVPIHGGDILYVPSTIFHKASRILDPLLDPVYKAAVARNLAE